LTDRPPDLGPCCETQAVEQVSITRVEILVPIVLRFDSEMPLAPKGGVAGLFVIQCSKLGKNLANDQPQCYKIKQMAKKYTKKSSKI
jgi:hypothetical protein